VHFLSIVIIIGYCFGFADFFERFFLGFTSTPGPMQLFFPAIENRLMVFPAGMILQFLVPDAIFFHMLSLRNHLKFERMPQREV